MDGLPAHWARVLWLRSSLPLPLNQPLTCRVSTLSPDGRGHSMTAAVMQSCGRSQKAIRGRQCPLFLHHGLHCPGARLPRLPVLCGPAGRILEQFSLAWALCWEVKKMEKRPVGQGRAVAGALPGRWLPSRTDGWTDRRHDGTMLRAFGSSQFLPSSEGTHGHAGCPAGGVSLRLLLVPVVWKERHTRGPLCAGDVPPPRGLTHAIPGI